MTARDTQPPPLPNASVILLAAGVGRRMGAGTPKQFLPLAGVPLIEHSLRFFLARDWVERICLVIESDSEHGAAIDSARALATAARKPLSIARGGARRQDSTIAGLHALPAETRLVAIHDSARPFPPLEPVEEALLAAQATGGAILAARPTDTVKRASPARTKDGSRTIAESIDRTTLWLAQTPQIFQFAALFDAMKRAQMDGAELTDEAMAFERLGMPVALIESTADNFKVTHPADFERAEAMLK